MGLGSGVKVNVGGASVKVKVGEGVIVTVLVGVDGMTTSGCDRNARKTRIAPIAKNTARSKIATGKLRVTSGILLVCTDLSGFPGLSAVPKLAPQTRQRFASKGTRVPQVGHILVEVGESVLIMFFFLLFSSSLRIIPSSWFDVKLVHS